jgi:hypothetical protein
LQSGFEKSIAIKFVVAARLIPENQNLNLAAAFHFFRVTVSGSDFMANEAEMRVRFDRVISALRGVIDSLTARESALEEYRKGTVGVYADSAIACMNARQAFEDETPTMDALVIALRDNCYKDPTWPADNMDDAKALRIAWYAIHNTIEAGRSFAPDDIGGMRNLCAALERARKKYSKAKGVGRPKGASLSKYETECLRHYLAGRKPSDIDEMMMKRSGSKRKSGQEWDWGTAKLVIEAAKTRGEIPRKSGKAIS